MQDGCGMGARPHPTFPQSRWTAGRNEPAQRVGEQILIFSVL